MATKSKTRTKAQAQSKAPAANDSKALPAPNWPALDVNTLLISKGNSIDGTKASKARTKVSPAERRELAGIAAGQLERICLAFMAQSEPDKAHGNDPRPMPAVVMYEMAARGRDLTGAIMDALDDALVTTEDIQRVVRSIDGTFPAIGRPDHD